MPANVGPIVAPKAYLPTTLLETTFRELAEGNARRLHAQIARRLNRVHECERGASERIEHLKRDEFSWRNTKIEGQSRAGNDGQKS